jgi:hypothetical protein
LRLGITVPRLLKRIENPRRSESLDMIPIYTICTEQGKGELPREGSMWDEITFTVHSMVSENDKQRVLIKSISDTLLICFCSLLTLLDGRDLRDDLHG